MAGNFFVMAFCKNSARFAPTRVATDSNLGRNSCFRGATRFCRHKGGLLNFSDVGYSTMSLNTCIHKYVMPSCYVDLLRAEVASGTL